MKTSKVRLVLAVGLTLVASRGRAQTAPGGVSAAQGVPPRPHGLEAYPSRELTPPTGAESRRPRPEALTSFDPATLELSWNEGHWSVNAAGRPLKDFGRRAEDARQAWHLMRELRLNQRGTIGAPQPVLEYWLTDGRPPQVLPRGVRMLSIDLAGLHVEQAQGNWVVREPGRPLFSFGSHKEEAELALAVLRKYGFNQVGVIGHGAVGMLVFVARPEGGGRNAAAAGLQPGRQMSLKPDANTEAGRQQAAALALSAKSLAARKGSAVPANFPIVPALPSLQPDALPAARLPGQDRPSRFLTAQVPRDRPDVVTERVPFDWRQVQVRRDSGDWKLVAGSYTLANFGMSEHDARLAHAALVHYRCTEHQLVGGPEPAAGYFLANGQAPLGVMVGLFNDSFQPDAVTVRPVGKHFCVTQGNHPILDCGTRPDEARYMVDVIRQYRFDHVCRIGSDDRHTLTLLVRSH